MPRTTTVDLPGCPPIRALTFDTLGFIKVVECHGDQNHPQVVDRWGSPDVANSVVAASIADSVKDPLLAVARKCGKIEVLNPLSGKLSTSFNCGDPSASENNGVVGLHLFRRHKSSGNCKLLTCTVQGDVRLWPVNYDDLTGDDDGGDASSSLNICGSGNIECCQVDAGENYALFGGKRIEVNVWDLETLTKTWTAKSPPKNSLGIFSPTWFTSATFLSDDDPRRFVAGTNNHQVRLYDTSTQRRPVMSFDFRETPIRAISKERDERTIYLGTGSGDLASVDIRTGKLLGCFVGKCCGSIRSIARHPVLPVLASCGLDSYLRLWDVKTRQPLSAIFLKQHLTNVLFDSNFVAKVAPETKAIHDNHSEVKEAPPVNSRLKLKTDKSKKRSSTPLREMPPKSKKRQGITYTHS